MKRDNRQNTAGHQNLLRCQKRAVKLAQLIIDENAQRLKYPGCRINLSAAPQRIGDNFRQTVGRCNRLDLSGTHDEISAAARSALLAVNLKNTDKVFVRKVIHCVRRRQALACHAHIQRTFAHEGKPARSLIKLHG